MGKILNFNYQLCGVLFFIFTIPPSWDFLIIRKKYFLPSYVHKLIAKERGKISPNLRSGRRGGHPSPKSSPKDPPRKKTLAYIIGNVVNSQAVNYHNPKQQLTYANRIYNRSFSMFPILIGEFSLYIIFYYFVVCLKPRQSFLFCKLHITWFHKEDDFKFPYRISCSCLMAVGSS